MKPLWMFGVFNNTGNGQFLPDNTKKKSCLEMPYGAF